MWFNQVDGSPEDLDARKGDEGEAVPQSVWHDAPDLPGQTEADEVSEVFVHACRTVLSLCCRLA